MQVNETLCTYDLAEALRGEMGKFECTTSSGMRLTVTAMPGHSIVSLRCTNDVGPEQVIWIKKIADFQSQPMPHFRSQVA